MQKIDYRIELAGPKLCRQAKVFCEEILVHTDDKYILSVFHLFTDLKKNSIIFIHRPGGTGEDFLLNPNSFIFKLVLKGFDIWLVNLRGTIFSQRHLNLSETGPEFWDFSPVEIIRFDVQGIVDYVIKVTKSKSVNVVAIGEYGMIIASLMGANENYLKNVDKVVWIAAGCEEMLKGSWWSHLIAFNWYSKVLESFGVFSVFGKRSVFFGQIIQAFPCISKFFAQNKYGWELDQEEINNISYYETVATGHISLKTLNFFSQGQYLPLPNFGEEKNQKVYGRPNPLLSNFKYPVQKFALFLSNSCTNPSNLFQNDSIFHTSTYNLDTCGFLLAKNQSFYPNLLSILNT